MKCAMEWEADPKLYVIDIDFKGDQVRDYQRLLNEMEIRVIDYIERASPSMSFEDVRRIWRKHGGHVVEESHWFSPLIDFVTKYVRFFLGL